MEIGSGGLATYGNKRRVLTIRADGLRVIGLISRVNGSMWKDIFLLSYREKCLSVHPQPMLYCFAYPVRPLGIQSGV